jgi:hypothetical protein
VGLNFIETTQCAAAARVLPQVFEEIRKSPAAVPEIAKPVKLTLTVPLLVTVTDLATLVRPTVTVPKLSEVGEREIMVPVPLMFRTCGLPPPLSLTLRVALRGPITVGWNVSPTTQFVPAASVLPQPFEEI